MITLTSPQFGDTYTFDCKAQHQRTQSDTIVPIYDSEWPELHTFSVSFYGLTDSEKTTFETFFRTNAGLTISYTDHEGQDWSGIVTSEQILFTQNRQTCHWSVAFDFAGVKT